MKFWQVMNGFTEGVSSALIKPVQNKSIQAANSVKRTVIDLKKKSQREYELAFNKGKLAGKAENLLKIRKLTENLKNAADRFWETKEYCDLLIAMFAVGISVANCDGEIVSEEKQDIDEFIAGVSHSHLPSSIKKKINTMYDNPPNFNTAMNLVKKIDSECWDLFSQVIEIVSSSDGFIKTEEVAYKEAWLKFVKSQRSQKNAKIHSEILSQKASPA
jgi:hypothetical protein